MNEPDFAEMVDKAMSWVSRRDYATWVVVYRRAADRMQEIAKNDLRRQNRVVGKMVKLKSEKNSLTESMAE